MFPANSDSARGRELQEKLNAAGTDWVDWPEPRTVDYVFIGQLVVVYNYIDFSLRRLSEMFDKNGLFIPPWKGKSLTLNMADTAKAVQSAHVWKDEDVVVLLEIEKHRGMRNLFAHCTVRRFPDEDAFALFIKSARDYKREFGREPPLGVALNVTMDSQQLSQTVKRAIFLQEWLGHATAKLEKALAATKIPMSEKSDIIR